MPSLHDFFLTLPQLEIEVDATIRSSSARLEAEQNLFARLEWGAPVFVAAKDRLNILTEETVVFKIQVLTLGKLPLLLPRHTACTLTSFIWVIVRAEVEAHLQLTDTRLPRLRGAWLQKANASKEDGSKEMQAMSRHEIKNGGIDLVNIAILMAYHELGFLWLDRRTGANIDVIRNLFQTVQNDDRRVAFITHFGTHA